MRDDLLEAMECIDWTISKVPSIEQKVADWIDGNVDLVIRDSNGPGSDKLLIAKERTLMPLEFSVEIGAYINTIRTSLDILASSLSTRNGKAGNVEAHFPMFRSDLHMLDPKCGLESIKWLTPSQRTIIKSLEPYPGGNEVLRALHQLDIMRKHRRLLAVRITPTRFSVAGLKQEHFVIPQEFVGANDDTLLLILSPEATEGQINCSFCVSFNETGEYGTLPVQLALRRFAWLAGDIIKATPNNKRIGRSRSAGAVLIGDSGAVKRCVDSADGKGLSPNNGFSRPVVLERTCSSSPHENRRVGC